jgi:L-seryl-tRNA(Ser) seleniumtransferase
VKLEPRLPQLPTLHELLEHPRVKGLVERVNRSTIAQRAGGFLEEIRSSLVERAGRVEVPSIGHLAERLARRLLGEPAATGPIINATGVIYGDPSLALPLAEPALHAMVQVAGEYHRRDAGLADAAGRELARVAGAEAALVLNSFEGALTLALAATAGQREAVLVGVEDAADPINWRWVAARAGVVLSTRGEANPLTPGAANTIAAFVRRPSADVDLAALAEQKPRETRLIDAEPLAGTIDPRIYGFDSVPTIGERLAAGADLVIVDGAGLLGGPACGIAIGSWELVEQLAKHPLASLLAVDPLTTAALDAVLKLHRQDGTDAIVFQTPIWQLVSTPLANLEQRAARLASLMSEAPQLASAQSVAVTSPWRRHGSRAWEAPSWVIELTPRDGDDSGLVKRLAQGPYPIVVRQSGGTVQIDLRTVFPRWDQQLVAAVDATAESK